MWVKGTSHKCFSQLTTLSGEDGQEEGQGTGRWFNRWNACCSNRMLSAQLFSTHIKAEQSAKCLWPSSGVRQTPEAHWPASLARSLSLRFNERPWLKNQGREWQERHLTLTSDLYRQRAHIPHTNKCMLTDMYVHMHTPHIQEAHIRGGACQELILRWVLWIYVDESTLCFWMSNPTPRRQQTRTQK